MADSKAIEIFAPGKTQPIDNADLRHSLPAKVLFVLGLVDLMRGVLHTFFANWAVRTFAKLDLSAARQDQLTLLGVFGISNLLTGVIYILVSRRAKPLAKYVLLMIPCAYAAGWVGMRSAGITPQAAFYGKYFMLVYCGVCLLTVAYSSLHAREAISPSPQISADQRRFS